MILSTFFFASWARGFGLAKAVFEKAELKAKQDGFTVEPVLGNLLGR